MTANWAPYRAVLPGILNSTHYTPQLADQSPTRISHRDRPSMHQDDILWGFSPHKRARDESFEYALSDLGFPESTAGLSAKAARTRSMEWQPFERASSQSSIMDTLDFAEHRHMLHLSDSFGDLLDLASGARLECSSDALYPTETSGPVGISCQDPSDSSTALCNVESIDVGEPVDQGRFKLVSLLGYRRSLALASIGSKHVASGVPFMSSDAIEHCLVREPDLVQDLLQCF